MRFETFGERTQTCIHSFIRSFKKSLLSAYPFLVHELETSNKTQTNGRELTEMET